MLRLPMCGFFISLTLFATACGSTTAAASSCPQLTTFSQIVAQHSVSNIGFSFSKTGQRGGITADTPATDTYVGTGVLVSRSGQQVHVNGDLVTACSTPAPNAVMLTGTSFTVTLIAYS